MAHHEERGRTASGESKVGAGAGTGQSTWGPGLEPPRDLTVLLGNATEARQGRCRVRGMFVTMNLGSTRSKIPGRGKASVEEDWCHRAAASSQRRASNARSWRGKRDGEQVVLSWGAPLRRTRADHTGSPGADEGKKCRGLSPRRSGAHASSYSGGKEGCSPGRHEAGPTT